MRERNFVIRKGECMDVFILLVVLAFLYSLFTEISLGGGIMFAGIALAIALYKGLRLLSKRGQ